MALLASGHRTQHILNVFFRKIGPFLNKGHRSSAHVTGVGIQSLLGTPLPFLPCAIAHYFALAENHYQQTLHMVALSILGYLQYIIVHLARLCQLRRDPCALQKKYLFVTLLWHPDKARVGLGLLPAANLVAATVSRRSAQCDHNSSGEFCGHLADHSGY